MYRIYKYLLGTVFKPKKTFQELLTDDKRFNQAWLIILILLIAFSVPNLGLVLLKAVSPIPPVVRIPPQFVYLWILLVGIPAQISLLIMSAGHIYFLGRKFRGQTTFEDVFVINTFAMAVPFLLYGIFEISFFFYVLISKNKEPGLGALIAIAVFMLITIIWQMFLVPLGIYLTHNIKKLYCFLTAIINLVIFWIFAAIFFA